MHAAKAIRLREQMLRRRLQHGMVFQRAPGLHLRSFIRDLDMLSAARLRWSVIKATPQTLDPSVVQHARNNGIAVPVECLVYRAYERSGLEGPAVHGIKYCSVFHG